MLALSIALVVTACSGSPAQSGVKATLEPGPMAPLGGVIPFRVTVMYPMDVPGRSGATGAEVRIGLASGLALVDEGWTRKEVRSDVVQYSRPVTFQANVPQTFDFHVRLDQPGQHMLNTGAVVHFGENLEGKGVTKILDVRADGTTIHDQPAVYPTAVLGPQRDDELRESEQIEAPAPTP